jgi:hypothetical protein
MQNLTKHLRSLRNSIMMALKSGMRRLIAPIVLIIIPGESLYKCIYSPIMGVTYLSELSSPYRSHLFHKALNMLCRLIMSRYNIGFLLREHSEGDGSGLRSRSVLSSWHASMHLPAHVT